MKRPRRTEFGDIDATIIPLLMLALSLAALITVIGTP